MNSPTGKTKRELNRETKIAKILDAARELMEEAGEDAVTLRKLARKTGLSPNTIYAHFDHSRENVVKAIVISAMQDVGDFDERVLSLDEPGNTPWELAVNQFLQHPEFYRAVTLLKTREDPLYAADEQLSRLDLKARALLQEGVRNKLLSPDTDLDALERYFVHTFRGCAHRWARNEITDDGFRESLLYAIYTSLFFHATAKGKKVFHDFLNSTVPALVQRK